MKRFRDIRPIFKPLLIIGGVVLAAGLALLFGFFVMLLWNWLMPEIFGLKEITYWQAWGMVLLAHILFKAGKWGDHDNHCRDRHDGSRDGSPGDASEWKNRFKEKMEYHFGPRSSATEADTKDHTEDEDQGDET
jgi:hypothetical protein